MARPRPRRIAGPAPSLPPTVAGLLGDEATALLHALSSESPVSIRLNPLKPVDIPGEPIPWCAHGRYLPARPSFTLDPLLHAGAYYVQEASSMLVEQAFVRAGLGGRDILALDLCAAPGGKSTHLASLISPGSLLVCNELVPARQGALMENLWKQGFPHTVVTGSPTADFARMQSTFDLVLVDAPCSGEGMFRKDPFAREQWSEGLVRSCGAKQQEILDHAWHTLRPGGWLIYSTCTWERSENEDQVQRLVQGGAQWFPLELEESWGVRTTDAGHRCYPHRVRGEGFFIALLRKPGTDGERTLNASKGRTEADVAPWLHVPEAFDTVEAAGILFGSPAPWSTELTRLRTALRVVAPGIPVAERKGDRWKPHPALALNRALAAEAFPRTGLDRVQALAYLRGETGIQAGPNATGRTGVQLMCYAGLPLGWMHAAGDRWNNGWPKPWRIRMR